MNRIRFVLLMVLGFGLNPAFAQLPNFPAADLVLGAPDFTTPGHASDSPSGLKNPEAVAVDPVSGKLFVSISGQHRILRFRNSASLANGENAEAVLGQINFSGSTSGTTQSKFNNPRGIHVDQQGRLWVADRSNNRVLMFQGAATLSNGAPADLVIGQADFVSNSSGTTAAKLNNPFGVFVDANDNLWIGDSSNHRVLKYPSASSLPVFSAAATVALGQPNLTTVTSGTSDVKFSFPEGLAMSDDGTLWIAEFDNHRVVRFDNAASLSSGAAASGVLGQPDFFTSSVGLSASKMESATGLALDTNGTLYVLVSTSQRVLIFKNAVDKPNGAAADGVIGQSDFTTDTAAVSARQFSNDPGHGIDIDASGALWVPDSNGRRVLRFSPDRTGPVLRVTTRVPRSTTKGSLALKGTATDLSGIALVRFRSGGAFRNAAGTTSWSAKARLKKGKNRIEIIATDGAGNNSRTKRLSVART